VPARYADYLARASKSGDDTAFRHYWEMCTVLALRDELASLLPFVPIASLLIELNARTDFLARFTHAGGRKSAQSVELKRNILAVLIAGATSLGLTRMSEACGVSCDTLAWTQEWYVREETLRDANTVIVNHHYGLELAGKFGGGTMPSSDGQRFPVRGKSLTGRDMVIHEGRVLPAYPHVCDQWPTYGTKQIVATHREGHKGESPHALRPDLHYAQQSTIARPHLQDQTEQARCHTLPTNSVTTTWAAEYYRTGIGEPRSPRRDIPDELLSFTAPGHRENINHSSFIRADIQAELAKLIEGWRPLRPTTVTEPGTSFMPGP